MSIDLLLYIVAAILLFLAGINVPIGNTRLEWIAASLLVLTLIV